MGKSGHILSILLFFLMTVITSEPVWSGQDDFKTCCENLKRMSEALKKYDLQCGNLPKSLSEIGGTYLKTLPTCPMGGQYEYTVAMNGKRYTLECRGWAHRDVIGKSQPIIISFHESLEVLPEPTPMSSLDEKVKKAQMRRKLNSLRENIKRHPYFVGALLFFVILILMFWIKTNRSKKRTLEKIEDFIS